MAAFFFIPLCHNGQIHTALQKERKNTWKEETRFHFFCYNAKHEKVGVEFNERIDRILLRLLILQYLEVLEVQVQKIFVWNAIEMVQVSLRVMVVKILFVPNMLLSINKI